MSCQDAGDGALHLVPALPRVVEERACRFVSDFRLPSSTGRLAVRRPAGFSAPGREIPQAWLNGGSNNAEYGCSSRHPDGSVGFLLACSGSELHVFRAAVGLIVLTLAMGPSAVLLCQAWCDPHEAAATGCHSDRTTSPSLIGNDNCTDTFGALAFVREDVRRGTSTPDAPHAVVIPAFRFAPPPTAIRSDHDPGQQSPHEARPLVTPLRI